MKNILHTYLLWSIIVLMVPCMGCKEKIADLDESKTTDVDYTLVKVQDVEISNEPIPIYSIGKVGSDEEIKLSFKIGGIISELRGKEGMSIRKGAVLAQLRTNEIDAQVMKASRALEKAERDLDRVRSLHREGAATLENIQDLSTLVDVSRADLEVARFNQNYAKITSPVFGRILLKNAEAGELVGPGQPVFVIASSQNSSLLKASISDKDISKINYGDRAKIAFDAYPNEIFYGTVLRVSESADPRTGTFEVDIDINERGKRLRNGYIGRVELYPRQVSSYLKIPIEALVESVSDEVIIYTPEGSIARKRKVTPLYIGENFFTISRNADDGIIQVITTGAPYLMDGSKIKIN